MPGISPRHLLPLLWLFRSLSVSVQVFPGHQRLTLFCSHSTWELILHLRFLFATSPSHILCNPMHWDPMGTNCMPGIHSLLLRGVTLSLKTFASKGVKFTFVKHLFWLSPCHLRTACLKRSLTQSDPQTYKYV